MKKGKYVVIEGLDGTGKTTQIPLIQKRLANIGIESISPIEEPAGTPISDEIRSIIKNGSLERDALTNLLLFSAARHEIWIQKVEPALKIGKWVVASRNYYSTLAYQGYGEGLDLNLIENQTRIATNSQYMTPDVAMILDLDDEDERARRVGLRGTLKHPDTFESRASDFQADVRSGYLKIAETHHLPIISANQSIEDVNEDIWAHINSTL